MASHLEFGREAEEQAALWFAHRYPSRLLERNFRSKRGEIDLVFEQFGEGVAELVFIEVRARQKGALVSGIESIGPKKRRRLRRAIRLFTVRYRGKARSMRLDVMAWDGERWEHLKNVWI